MFFFLGSVSAVIFCWNQVLFLLEPVICFLLWEEFFAGTGVSFARISASGEFCWDQDVVLLETEMCFAATDGNFCYLVIPSSLNFARSSTLFFGTIALLFAATK